MAKQSRRASKALKTPEQRVKTLRRRILPEIQAGRDEWKMVDVVNHTDADQRHSMRSEQKRTIRRKTKLEQLHHRGILDVRQLRACEWYAEAHEVLYVKGCKISSYGDSGGRGGRTNFDHLPKNRRHEIMLKEFDQAREGINGMLLPMFERVVLHGRPLGKLKLSFQLAVKQLLGRIDGRVTL